jgi:hypothetical protein
VTSLRKVLVRSYDDNINTYQADGNQILILDPSNDNDGDGLTNYEERYVYHTNAEIADTDGDGVDDGTEIKDGRDPLIAEIPDISFVVKSLPTIVAHLSRSVGGSSSREISSGGDYTNSSSFSSESQVNASLEVALMVGGEYKFGLDGGATIHGDVTTTVGAGFSQTWTTEQSESMSRNWNEAVNTASSNDVTVDGGSIVIDVQLINNSGQDFTLVSPLVRLTENGVSSSTLGTVIGELALVDASDVYLSSKSGNNSVVRQFHVDISNPDILEQIAERTSGLVAQLTNIQFRVSTGGIDTLMSNVYRRTAEVVVDPGFYSSAPMVKKRAVTCNRYNEFYTSYLDRYLAASLDDVVRMVGVSPVLDSTNGKFGIRSIGGLANGDFKTGTWGALIQTTTDSVRVFAPTLAGYDPRLISVGGASVVSVVYSADEDGDGLPGRLEAALGTSDHNPDSDSDGISDGAEYFGWRRPTDPAGVLWKTNPRMKDTDGDGISDSADDNPMVPKANASDSVVSVKKISIVPTQGSSWSTASAVVDSVATVAVNQTFRGNTTISLEFDRPVRQIMITRRGGGDTTALYSPDQGTIATYTANLNLVLGADTVDIRAVSRNGVARQRIALTGIDRRLIHLTNAQYSVTKPSTDLQHKAMNVAVDLGKVTALDSLVTGVHLFRTHAFGAPVAAADSAAILQANDLGDAGDGTLNLVPGNTVTGKDGSHNTYTLDQIFTTSQTVTDTMLIRDNDHVFFLYAAHQDGQKNWFSAPVQGVYVKPNRTVIVDSITLVNNCSHGWGLGTDWETINRVQIVIGTRFDKDTSHDQWLNAGRQNNLAVPVGSAYKIEDADSIAFPSAKIGGANFIDNVLGTWETASSVGSLKPSVKSYEITHPAKYLANFAGYYQGSDFSTAGNNRYFGNDFSIRGSVNFTTEWDIHWHYEVGPTTAQ